MAPCPATTSGGSVTSKPSGSEQMDLEFKGDAHPEARGNAVTERTASHGKSPAHSRVPSVCSLRTEVVGAGLQEETKAQRGGQLAQGHRAEAGSDGVAGSKAEPCTHTWSVLDARGQGCAHCHISFAVKSKGGPESEARPDHQTPSRRSRTHGVGGWGTKGWTLTRPHRVPEL